jgi:hypothetical protein
MMLLLQLVFPPVGREHSPYTLEWSDITGVYSSFPPTVCWLVRPGLDKTNLLNMLENLAACTVSRRQ